MNETQGNLLLAAAILKPFLDLFLAVFLPLIAGALAVRLNSFITYKTEGERLKGEETLRDRIHKASENAILFAMARLGYFPTTGPVLSNLLVDVEKAGKGDTAAAIRVQSVYDMAVNEYLKPKMADSISKLGASDKDLLDIVTSKVGRV